MAVRYTDKDALKFVQAGAQPKNGSGSNKKRN